MRLRDTIDASDLPANQKAALHAKLIELVEELEKRRLNLGRVMLTLSLVMAGLASVTTIAADGNAAITHILRLVGIDKQSENEALSRIAPPPKVLPAPQQKAPYGQKHSAPGWESASNGGLDDEIPF